MSERPSSLSSEWPTIKMMSELGVLKQYPFTHLSDDVPTLKEVQCGVWWASSRGKETRAYSGINI